MEQTLMDQQPTLLAKILGVYKLSYSNKVTNKQNKMYLLVMENLFYNRTIVQKFDLKGNLITTILFMALLTCFII